MQQLRISDKIFFTVICLMIIPLQGAQSEADTTVQLQPFRIENDFDITAELEQSAWQEASSVFIAHQVQPNDNVPALVDTEVKVLYSEEHLYIGFICDDPNPRNIRANVSDRDNSFNDDFVGVFIDPFNNNQFAYELFVNPLGIQMDGMRTGNSEDMNFDMLWSSEGQINDTGYQAVMKIPFKSLNFPKQEVQDWTIQFIRNYPRNNRYQFAWSDINLNNPCLMCQSGLLTGMDGVESSKTIELLPYAMSYQTSQLNTIGDPTSGLDHGPPKGRLGWSVRYSPFNNLVECSF